MLTPLPDADTAPGYRTTAPTIRTRRVAPATGTRPADLAWEAVCSTILTGPPAPDENDGPVAAAVALGAAELPARAPAEGAVLREWLDRVIAG